MGILAKLASQTAIYGISSIFGRFLNYLLVPLYTYHFSTAEYGIVSEFYAYAGFFSVFLLFGFETGYFRFRDKEHPEHDLAYSSALMFVVLVNLSFFLLILTFNNQLSSSLNYPDHPEYVLYFTIILTLDAVSAIPFARLRAEERAVRFAVIKVLEIICTVFFSLFFIVYCPKLDAQNAHSWIMSIYNPAVGIGYIFIANLMASVFKFVLLTPQLIAIANGFDKSLFFRMLRYSSPMVVIGFAGAINEMLDRALLKYLLPYDAQTNLKMLGVYGACYKLSILMTLFVQAFRYAAEPFFFAYAAKYDARKVYADVLKFFVIFCVFIFLTVTLFIDFFKYFIGEEFRSGLDVVPILLMANLFLGIYINLSIWYKLTDRTGMGAVVSMLGAVLTVLLNVWWIPTLGYYGSAWATLICYALMAMVSYFLGKKYYRINYPYKRILGYIGLGVSLYFLQQHLTKHFLYNVQLLAFELLLIYLLTVVLLEKRKLLVRLGRKIPK